MEKDFPKELDFQPLTPGLGFHPFSDGLPYAPLSKAPAQTKPVPAGRPASSTGSGAVAAGAPRFATTLPIPAPAMPSRVSVPVAQKSAKAEPASATRPQPAAPNLVFGWAYPFKRALAWILDSALNTSICFGALSAALWNQNLAPELLLNPGTIVVSMLFFAAFSWALIAAQEIAFGTTVGKRLFGLTLRGNATAIFLRAFFFVPSMGFAGAGLLWSLIDSRKRCWHDLVVDLQPLETSRL